MATDKKLNDYQLFINDKVALLKVMDEHKDKKYMEIRKIANDEWRIEHPVDPNKPIAKPRVKKEGATAKPRITAKVAAKAVLKDMKDAAIAKKAAAKAAKDAKASAKADKPKRPQSDYIIFISKILPEIKIANPTLAQKELMSMAAAKWQEHKLTLKV